MPDRMSDYMPSGLSKKHQDICHVEDQTHFETNLATLSEINSDILFDIRHTFRHFIWYLL